jgi:spore coat protein U-like protein
MPRVRHGTWRAVFACIALFAATSAHAVHTCTVGVGNVNFGAFTGVQITSSSTMTVSCTITSGLIDNVNFTATLSTGAGSYAQRLLTHVGPPADTLPYNLYLNTVPAILNTSVWGDGSGSTVTATGGPLQLIIIFAPTKSATFTVAGAMPAVASLPTAGTYSDTIVATLTYN